MVHDSQVFAPGCGPGAEECAALLLESSFSAPHAAELLIGFAPGSRVLGV